MDLNLNNVLLLVTAFMTALVAGLFYAWSCGVTGGLARLTDREYIATMQSINRVIQNPLFLIAFMGLVLLLPLCSYMHYSRSVKFYLLLGATILYLAGVIGVSFLGNIPMNEALDKFDLASATPADMGRQRLAYEGKWNSLNHIRTMASAASLLLLLIACIGTREN